MTHEGTNSAIYLHALTPIHCGTGQVSASVIDLPVAREKTTGWPVVPATSLKGVLKELCPLGKRDGLFGGEDRENRTTSRGVLQFGDAHLLCFPVRSFAGVFAYVTSPLALHRLKRDFNALGVPVPFDGSIDDGSPSADGVLLTSSTLVHRDSAYFDDLELSATEDQRANGIAHGIADAVFDSEADKTFFIERFAIVSNHIFQFLTEAATEVTARIKLEDEQKKVQAGGLWYEEAVPAEAIFAAPLLGGRLPDLPATIQIGGSETVGRGICRINIKDNE